MQVCVCRKRMCGLVTQVCMRSLLTTTLDRIGCRDDVTTIYCICVVSANQLLCPPFAESRFHLLFTAKASLFKVDGVADDIHMRTSGMWFVFGRAEQIESLPT
jgi:hypothetical protein